MQVAALIGSIATVATMIQMESNIDIVFKYNSQAQYFWIDINYGIEPHEELSYGIEPHEELSYGIEPHEELSAWLDEGEKLSEERLQAIVNRLTDIYQGIKKAVA